MTDRETIEVLRRLNMELAHSLAESRREINSLRDRNDALRDADISTECDMDARERMRIADLGE